MRQLTTPKSSQAGFVSLFTTIFFMLFITVITLGFLQIMASEQQQSINNDLTASALASAQSGIEDGKRAVLKYFSLPAGLQKNTYRTQMTSPKSDTCNALTGSIIGTDLGLDPNGNVVNNAQIDQAYSCLSVNLDSPDYISQSSAGKSDLIPLRAVGGQFERVKISWHLISAAIGSDGDGVPKAYSPTDALNPLVNPISPPASWSQLGYPAYVRAQLYGYPSGSFGRPELTQRSRTALLAPGTIGASSTSPINWGTADPNPGVFAQAELRPTMIQCNPSFASTSALGSYACTALLELPAGAAFASTTNTYFLRLTPIYGQTHYRIALVHSGSEVAMDEVQPIVDVTGRANDVFRRVQARVRVNALANFPEFAAETANTICKNLQVSSNTADYKANNCP